MTGGAVSLGDGCAKVQPLLETFKDGELGTDSILSVEAHLDHCTRCSEELELLLAIQGSVRKAVRDDAVVSEAFLGRLRTSLDAEREREASEDESERQLTSLERWRSRAWPALAVAAAAALWLWRPTPNERMNARSGDPVMENHAEVAYGAPSVQELLDKLVDYHSHPPQPQVTEPALVPRFEQQVGVRVELPRLTQYGAHWTGGSVVPVNNQRAAFLNYDLPGYDAPAGRRITLYVYDSERVPVHASLEPRMVQNQAVYVGKRRGYSIAARQRAGIGYAIATDLDDQESAEIIASLNTLH